MRRVELREAIGTSPTFSKGFLLFLLMELFLKFLSVSYDGTPNFSLRKKSLV